MERKNTKNAVAVYCHFSFRRPKGKDYGLFSVAFYWDYEGKKLAAQATRRLPLWENHQFITAIQSYEHALYSIYNWQGIMQERGITNVLLVTDNSTLAGWIKDKKKNKTYTKWMDKATEQYRANGPREIVLSVGLCNVRDYEKSYKYCKEDKVINDSNSIVKEENSNKKKIDLSKSNVEYKTITEMQEENQARPKIEGLN